MTVLNGVVLILRTAAIAHSHGGCVFHKAWSAHREDTNFAIFSSSFATDGKMH